MKRLLLIGLLALLVVGTAIAAWAQEDGNFVELPTGCEPDNMAAMEAASPVVSFATACETYLACRSNGSSNCDWPVASILLDACEPDDRICRIVSLLHVADLAMHQPPYDDPGLVLWKSEKSRLFPDVLELISGGDYNAAAEIYAGPYDLLYAHEAEYYAAGLIDELRGLPEEALAAFAESERINPAYWLMLFSRAQLLGDLGRTTEASLDTARIAEHITEDSPGLLPMIAPLVGAYPLDQSRFSRWLAYPVLQVSIAPLDPGAYGFFDRTRSEPDPVQIAEYPDLSLLAVLGFPTQGRGHALQVAQLPAQGGRISFTTGERTFIDGFPQITPYIIEGSAFYVQHNLIIATDTSFSGESGGVSSYLLVPADQPDPRLVLGERQCEGGVISRLRPHMVVMRQYYYPGEIHMASEPAGETTSDRSFSSGVVLGEEPVCIGSTLWWPAQDYEGQIGWIPENRDDAYLINPANGSGYLYCPGSLPRRLSVFGWAHAVNEATPQSLFSGPNAASSPLREIAANESVRVVREPICEGTTVWWQVRTEDGQTGYMAESDADTYFLEPVPEVAP